MQRSRTVERESEQKAHQHALRLECRQRLAISGVTDVKSFDEQQIDLITDCGALTVEGEALHVGTLDIARGEVAVEGSISALYYSDGAPTKRGRRGGR
jgi:sporulation protein YabP